MASDEIRPALSPEEWAAFPDRPSARPTWGEPLPLYYPTRHGVAAANLHGQPFGFTPADVEMCRLLAGNHTIDFDELEAWAASMRARLAALLPPSDDFPTQG